MDVNNTAFVIIKGEEIETTTLFIKKEKKFGVMLYGHRRERSGECLFNEIYYQNITIQPLFLLQCLANAMQFQILSFSLLFSQRNKIQRMSQKQKKFA